MAVGQVHHIELWVPSLSRAISSIGWMLEALGYVGFQSWEQGRSWQLGPTYIVVEQSLAMVHDHHDRCRPGMNHLAFHAGSRHDVDRLVTDAAQYGWTLMFPGEHPYAGGPDHYAAFLENDDGFEVELVAG